LIFGEGPNGAPFPVSEIDIDTAAGLEKLMNGV
jgi:hypothetical protein